MTSLVGLSMDELPAPSVELDTETTSMSPLSSLPSSPVLPNIKLQNPPEPYLEQTKNLETLVLLTILLATIYALCLCPQDNV